MHPKKHELYRTNAVFRKLSTWTAHGVGHPWTFAAALALIVVWAVTGPLFHFSDTWQLVINTGTTIITFLIVFLIQNTQNRDSHAIHLKLDELIRATGRARNHLIALEQLTDDELEDLQEEFETLAHRKLRERSQSKGSEAQA